jgi:hypothetical protein
MDFRSILDLNRDLSSDTSQSEFPAPNGKEDPLTGGGRKRRINKSQLPLWLLALVVILCV